VQGEPCFSNLAGDVRPLFIWGRKVHVCFQNIARNGSRSLIRRHEGSRFNIPSDHNRNQLLALSCVSLSPAKSSQESVVILRFDGPRNAGGHSQKQDDGRSEGRNDELDEFALFPLDINRCYRRLSSGLCCAKSDNASLFCSRRSLILIRHICGTFGHPCRQRAFPPAAHCP